MAKLPELTTTHAVVRECPVGSISDSRCLPRDEQKTLSLSRLRAHLAPDRDRRECASHFVDPPAATAPTPLVQELLHTTLLARALRIDENQCEVVAPQLKASIHLSFAWFLVATPTTARKMRHIAESRTE